jgi:predicted HicB family RNase H-like nuclease
MASGRDAVQHKDEIVPGERPRRAEPKPKPVGVLVRLTPRQHDALRRVAAEQEVTISTLVRGAIADILLRHGK